MATTRSMTSKSGPNSKTTSKKGCSTTATPIRKAQTSTSKVTLKSIEDQKAQAKAQAKALRLKLQALRQELRKSKFANRSEAYKDVQSGFAQAIQGLRIIAADPSPAPPPPKGVEYTWGHDWDPYGYDY